MPQPPLALKKYLSTLLPTVRENFPAGGGATGERKEYDTKLKGVSIIEDFNEKVVAFTKTLPDQAVSAHPAHPFPLFLTVLPGLPKEVKAAQDVQQYLRQLPLAATSATLCALTGVERSLDYASAQSGNKTLDAAGYESDGGETPATLAKDSNGGDHHEEEGDAGKTETGHLDVPGPSWGWKFAKSPLGSGEFLLIDEKEPEKVLLVVRTINKTAFSAADWDEYVYEGPYHYNIKSKASWYHSRNYKATKRLGCRYFVFTDYQRWLFGVFSKDRTHLNITPILPLTSTGPSVLEALVYWTKSALDQGESGGYKAVVKDVQDKPAPFEGEGVGKKAGKESGVSVGAESDIEE